jgi:hypothetical protein
MIYGIDRTGPLYLLALTMEDIYLFSVFLATLERGNIENDLDPDQLNLMFVALLVYSI